MKTLNLTIDFSFSKEENPDYKKVWEGFILGGCRSTFKDGVDLKLNSKLFKIFDKIQKSEGSVELEDAEFDILKDIQERGKFDPSANKVLYQINQKIEESKKQE